MRKRLVRLLQRIFLRRPTYLFLEPRSAPLLSLIYKSRFYRWYISHTTPSMEIDGDVSAIYDYARRYDLYEHLAQKVRLAEAALDYLEFGVYKGASLRWWSEHNTNPGSRFYGFDTFTGLPETWKEKPAGTFSTGGRMPDINDDRCSFVPGLFQDTLRAFLSSARLDRQLLVHMDADLYSSTLYVLTSLGPYMKNGDIVVFDEFRSEMHEFKAFVDFVAAYGVEFEVLAFVNKGDQIAFRIERQ